ncbi:MAG: hypothetical protein GY811_15570 [Myxococcales bacterium]|nr:hypothetical protein [Myxococcales bacterium]
MVFVPNLLVLSVDRGSTLYSLPEIESPTYPYEVAFLDDDAFAFTDWDSIVRVELPDP